jgi:hypothetical protein
MDYHTFGKTLKNIIHSAKEYRTIYIFYYELDEFFPDTHHFICEFNDPYTKHLVKIDMALQELNYLRFRIAVRIIDLHCLYDLDRWTYQIKTIENAFYKFNQKDILHSLTTKMSKRIINNDYIFTKVSNGLKKVFIQQFGV